MFWGQVLTGGKDGLWLCFAELWAGGHLSAVLVLPISSSSHPRMGKGSGLCLHLLRVCYGSVMPFHVHCGVPRKISDRWRPCIVLSNNAAISIYLALFDQSSSCPTGPSQPPQAAGPTSFYVAELERGPSEASALPVART